MTPAQTAAVQCSSVNLNSLPELLFSVHLMELSWMALLFLRDELTVKHFCAQQGITYTFSRYEV